MNGKVLVIEDDPDIALAIGTVLRRGRFDVVSAADGRDGLRAFHAQRPDLVLLDIGLPVLDGWAVLERIRDLSNAPVLMLTAHRLEADKVQGLRAGADDYLTKPFGNNELLARVHALLRRYRTTEPESEIYDDGVVRVSFAVREVRVADGEVTLTPLEFRLLSALVRHAGQVLSLEQLLELAWNDPLAVGPERVKFAVMRLRRKLGEHADETSLIEAIRGSGYRYVAPRAERRHGFHRPGGHCKPSGR